MEKDSMYYGGYLQLDQVLSSQHPVSFNDPNIPAHDEMLFIIIHQAYELWFKQILFEFDYVISVFKKDHINDNSEDLNLVRHRLRRVTKILALLNQQVDILDTMTPLDFLAFRNLLTPSSGFQSLQFRFIEARLGLDISNRHEKDYYKRTNAGGFNTSDFDQINNIESQQSLIHLINNWLERMPFFSDELWTSFDVKISNDLHPFWQAYRALYQQSLTEREQLKVNDFDYIFFEKKNIDYSIDQINNLTTTLSPAAMRSALFIMLYRDFPVFQTSYQILDSLIEIDNMLSNWRYKHLMMVRRMIGSRVGTGNTSGSGYLEGALNKHYIYKDLASLSSYLIQRSKLPKLPAELIQQLSFVAMA